MKYLKYYELEEGYHVEKDTLDYPSVSYTKDSDKVWYMKNNQIKMMFSITEDDVNNYGGSSLMVWENSVLFDSVKVDGVEQKTPVQKKDIIITGDTRGEIVDITIENSVIQGTITQAQPVSVEEEIMPAMSEVYPYVINMTEANQLPEVDSITYKLTTTSINNLAYKPSIYIRYAYASVAPEISESQSFNYQLLDWWTAQDSFSMVVSDDGTEIQFTMPSEVKITHLFIIPKASIEEANVSAGESAVEGIYLDDNNFLYSYDTDNILLPCQFGSLKFMFDESCYINDECIKKCDLIFNEPILGDWHKYFLTMQFQGYNDGMWMDFINFSQPLSVLIEDGATDCFIINEKSELVGVDLYYLSGSLLDQVGPTARMLAHVVYDENAVQNGETGNFIVNVNEDTLVGSYINMIIGGMPKLSLPTTEARDYEVVATIYNDVTDMSYMFLNCNALTSLDLSNFNTSNVTSMNYMFKSCSGLTSITWGNNFNTSNVTSMDGMFQNCSSLISLDLSNFDVSKVTGSTSMFYACNNLTSFKYFKKTPYKVIQVPSTVISIDLSAWDMSNVTDMGWMFAYCSGLTSLDLSSFDTSNVTNMHYMFSGCSSLTSLDLSSFNTSNVTSMNYMFKSCSGLTSITWGNNFNTSNVTSMSSMFDGCESLTSLDLSNFDTSNVTSMYQMFFDCSGLTSLDLSNFDTSNVTNMYGMFTSCRSLTSITFGSQADVSQVTSYSKMFYNITTTGALTYPSTYESAWNNILVTNKSKSYFPSTWSATAVDYENGETAPMSE